MSNTIQAAHHTELPDILELLESLNLDMEDVHFSQFVVSRDKGELIAVARVYVHEDGTHELCSLGVLPDYRMRGIGTEILHFLQEKFHGTTLWAVSDIPQYFERCGFKPSSAFSAALAEKLKICKEELDCQNPVVLSA